jgi:thioredoxin reductase (NADPH)
VQIQEGTVTDITRGDDGIFVLRTDENIYRAKTVVFATGTKHRELGVNGEKEYYGRGVSYCATCDGALFKGKRIGVVGGGDSAAKEALLLSDYGSHVWLFVRSKLRAEPINMRRIEQNAKISLAIPNEVLAIGGDGKKMTHVALKTDLDGQQTFPLDGLFIEIGHTPQTELAKSLGVALNAKGEIIIDRTSKTNVPGFFAAGDCTDAGWKQAIVSASEGSQAANSAYEYITNEFVRPA